MLVIFAVGITVILDVAGDALLELELELELEPAVRSNPAVVTMFVEGIIVDEDAGARSEETTFVDGITVSADLVDVVPPGAAAMDTRCDPPAVVEMFTDVGITVIVDDVEEEPVAKMRDGVVPDVMMFVGPVFAADVTAVAAFARTAFIVKAFFIGLD